MTIPVGMPVPLPQVSAMLFQRYQTNQQLIAARVLAAINSFWTNIVDPEHFSDSWRRLEPIVSGIVDTHYEMSAADASNYYGLSRAVSGFYGGAIPGAVLDPAYLNTVVNSMGVGQFYHHLDAGTEATIASTKAMSALGGASIRLVMNGGRDTVTRAASYDDVALGWERIVEPQSCSYCSGLAASGGVRKAESDTFPAHDRCGCLARVVFQGQYPANADLASEWARVTKGISNSKAASVAWDQYWSERNGNSSTTGQQRAALPAAPAQEEAGNAAIAGQPE